jgi:methanogenic corrinoid protein MtbC1
MSDLTAKHQQALFEAIAAAQVTKAEEVLATALREASAREVLLEVLDPVLVAIGEAWAKKTMVLAQGYLAAKLSERLLERVLDESRDDAVPPSPYGPVVLGNIEDDFHALGRRMVGLFLRASGWEVVDLGNDVPAADFVARAKAVGARVIGVSAMMYTTARSIRQVREALDREGLSRRVQLAVGGAVFNLRPELVAEVGGDGTAPSALQAPLVFEELAKRSLASERP